MKTAMQELIDELNELSNYHYTKAEYDICEGIGKCVELLISNIEKEKKQIIEGHFAGWSDAYDYLREDNNDRARQAEEYYQETYNQNK